MPITKRHKNFATWAGAVKDWNKNQAFHDELYGIPKKGSSFYDEVFELFYGKPVETPAPAAPAVPVPAPAAPAVPVPAPALAQSFSFGSNITDQITNIKKTLLSSYSSVEEQKAAIRLALRILEYKENNIIQEARKPLQRDLFLFLQEIKQNPKFNTYDLFGHSPASGKPMSKPHDLTEASKEIPVFQKNIVDEVMEQQKKQEKAQNKSFKEQQNLQKYEEQERKKRDAEEEKLVDKASIYAKFGNKGQNSPSVKFLDMLIDADITDYIKYKNKGKDLTGYTSREINFAFPTLFERIEERIENRPKPVLKENDAITAYIEALAEIKRNDSGKIMKGMMYNMNKSELEELNKMNNEMRERSKNVKTQNEIKAFNRKERELVSKFKERSIKRHYADQDKLAILKKAHDDAKGIKQEGIKQEPDVDPRGKMLSVDDSMKILSGFMKKGNAPPAKLAEMTKESEKAVDFIDDNWRGTSEVSKLPSHLRRHGFNWLESKYGGLYLQAVRKAKQVASEGRQSFKTEKEYRDFVNIDFAEYGVDYREFFKDVLFADTQLYFYLQKNANTTKAPSYTSSAREFQKYLDKRGK